MQCYTAEVVSCLICTHFTTPQMNERFCDPEQRTGRDELTQTALTGSHIFKRIQGCPVQFKLRTLHHHRNTAVIKNNDKASRTFFFFYLFEIFVPMPFGEELPPRYTGQHLYGFHKKKIYIIAKHVGESNIASLTVMCYTTSSIAFSARFPSSFLKSWYF